MCAPMAVSEVPVNTAAGGVECHVMYMAMVIVQHSLPSSLTIGMAKEV